MANLGYISIILQSDICCDPLLKPFHQNRSNEWSQHMFALRYKENKSELS